MLDTEELDEVGKEYVRNEMAMYIDQIKKGVEEAEKQKKDVGRNEMTDRLQYILAIDLCGHVRKCYLRSQDVMDRQALDARNTDAGVTDFHNFIVQSFNDTEWVPSTCAHGSLNEWRKERKQTNYDSDVDGEYYTNALQELESLILLWLNNNNKFLLGISQE
jgi:hypothetical protein